MSGPTAGREARIVAVLLAAGLSRRFGPDNKLLADIDGKPLVRRIAEQILAGPVDDVIVVLGHEAQSVRTALSGLTVTFVENERFAEGIGASVATGIAALGGDVDGAIVCLGDMPGQTPDTLRRLRAAHLADPDRPITYAATPDGRQRNPVLWPRRYFSELAALRGDTGARDVLAAHKQHALAVTLADEDLLADIDTPEALARHRGKGQSD